MQIFSRVNLGFTARDLQNKSMAEIRALKIAKGARIPPVNGANGRSSVYDSLGCRPEQPTPDTI